MPHILDLLHGFLKVFKTRFQNKKTGIFGNGNHDISTSGETEIATMSSSLFPSENYGQG